MITKTVVVEKCGYWYPDSSESDLDTKTVYEPGIGLKWEGDETMAVFYGNPERRLNTEGDTSLVYMRKAGVKSGKGGKGIYEFTHRDLGIPAYDYTLITPDLAWTTSINSPGTSAAFKFSPVQRPGQNTFDKNYDVMYAKGARDLPPAKSLEVSQFKRVFAPFCVKINGDFNGEKIRAVTTSFSKQPTDFKNCLTGIFYMKLGSDLYEDTKDGNTILADGCQISSVTGKSNAVTALYAEGLDKTGDTYNVWYMVNPNKITKGKTMTVNVTTDTKTYTKTVTLKEDVTIDCNKLNYITVAISPNPETSNTLFVDMSFPGLNGLPKGILASDGTTLNFVYGNNVAFGKDPKTGNVNKLPNMLRLNAKDNVASFTIPVVKDKKITKVRFYAHPAGNNQQFQGKDNTLWLNNSEIKYEFTNFVDKTKTASEMYPLIANGGYIDIPVPAEEQSAPIVVNASCPKNFIGIAAITLFTE